MKGKQRKKGKKAETKSKSASQRVRGEEEGQTQRREIKRENQFTIAGCHNH